MVKEWYASVAQDLPPITLRAMGGFTVLLTRDICLLCHLIRGQPAALLQYYAEPGEPAGVPAGSTAGGGYGSYRTLPAALPGSRKSAVQLKKTKIVTDF